MNSLDELVRAVKHAIEVYDTSGDHTRHEYTETDCIRCRLNAALPPYARKEAPRTWGTPG